MDVELKLVWAGDFNDPTKARQVADALIAEGCDVLMGSLNLGMFGVFEAVKSAPDKVLVTAKYTDKSTYAPDNYLTSLIYDFAGPLTAIYNKIQAGEMGGYYPLGFDTGVVIQTPLMNVDEISEYSNGSRHSRCYGWQNSGSQGYIRSQIVLKQYNKTRNFLNDFRGFLAIRKTRKSINFFYPFICSHH